MDTSEDLKNFIRHYKSTATPIPVNFRDLVPWIPYNSPRYTHQLHSYPAKIIPQIPNFFLSSKSLIRKQSTIVDPFSGSGTIALESCLANHNAIISDANPLARLLTRVKTTPQSPPELSQKTQLLKRLISQSRSATPPDVVNLEYWYSPSIIRQLSRVASTIQKLAPSNFKRLCEAALSSCARKASFADPKISVPVRLNPERYPKSHPLHQKSHELLSRLKNLNAIDLYFEVLDQFAAQVSSLWPIRAQFGKLAAIHLNSLESDIGSLTCQKTNSADAVITSPPYLGAQKYIRSCSLTLGWLSMIPSANLRDLEENSIGREHFSKREYTTLQKTLSPEIDGLLQSVFSVNPLRAHIASKYIVEMQEVFNTCYRILKPGGLLILVSGSNTLCGHIFDTTKYLRAICERLGFVPTLELSDTIKSRGLMTRRNRTAGMIPLESIILFRK